MPVWGKPRTSGPVPSVTLNQAHSRIPTPAVASCIRTIAGGDSSQALDSGPAPATERSSQAGNATPCKRAEVASGARCLDPCAAHIASTPRMTDRFCVHPRQPQRPMGGHADMVFLIGRCRRAVGRTGVARDACFRSSARRSSPRQSSGPNSAPVRRQERRQIKRQRRVHHQRNTALARWRRSRQWPARSDRRQRPRVRRESSRPTRCRRSVKPADCR